MKSYITTSATQTKKLGELLAGELHGGSASRRIIALSGELGSGKTTFTQGLLKSLGVKGPYTSPTFIVLKHYKRHVTIDQKQLTKMDLSNVKSQMSNVYHIDAYRVSAKDILNLGWEEIIADKNNIMIIEWADRIKKIIPKKAVWIKFEWIDKNKRKIAFMSS